MKMLTKQERYRNKKVMKGFKILRIWVHEDDYEQIKSYANKINNKRKLNEKAK